jgi:uncharacterized protein
MGSAKDSVTSRGERHWGRGLVAHTPHRVRTYRIYLTYIIWEYPYVHTYTYAKDFWSLCCCEITVIFCVRFGFPMKGVFSTATFVWVVVILPFVVTAFSPAPLLLGLTSVGSVAEGGAALQGTTTVPLAMSASSSSTSSSKNAATITVISQPDRTFLDQKGVWDWGTWGCSASTFPWTYDSSESCYLLQGKVIVTPSDGRQPPVTFGKGDFVTFPAGMSCTWEVVEAVQKHYMFH